MSDFVETKKKNTHDPLVRVPVQWLFGFRPAGSGHTLGHITCIVLFFVFSRCFRE